MGLPSVEWTYPLPLPCFSPRNRHRFWENGCASLRYQLRGDTSLTQRLRWSLPPDDFAEEVRKAYTLHGGGFGLIAVDTLSAFVNCNDWNDYSLTGSALSPIRQLARDLPQCSFLLFHHQNKANSDGWGGALGSTALTASADQLVKMGLSKTGKRTITVGGRYGTDPLSLRRGS